MKFDFGLSDGLLNAIRAKGFKAPTEIQRQVIPLILSRKDIIACSRTGSGKTMAYLLPLLQILGSHSTIIGARCLIIVPTRELGLQVASTLKFLLKFLGPDAPRYTLIVGGHVYEGQFEELAGNPDIIVATPGRLMEILQETEFSIARIEHLIFDEADSLFEMGYKLQLQEILNRASHQRQTVMLSATLPNSLNDFARSGMKEYILAKIDSEYQLNDKLQFHALVLRTEERLPMLIKMLEKLDKAAGQTIVFVSTRYVVELLEKVLKEAMKLSGGFLFGKMDSEYRTSVINDFRSGQLRFLVVTDLCARGIDIPEVDFIIHYEYPQNLKTFIHRSGRTARAGKYGTAFLFLTRHELPIAYEIERAVGRTVLLNEFADLTAKTPKPIDFEHFVDFLSAHKKGKPVSHPVFQELVEKTDSIHLGSVPEDYLFDSVHYIENLRKINEEIPKLEKYCARGNQKFLETRVAVERDAVKKSKLAGTIKNHFMFYDQDEMFKEVVTGIQNFKPQASVFELKYISKLNNAEQVQQSIGKLRDMKRQAADKERKKTEQATAGMEIEEPEESPDQQPEPADDNEEYDVELPDLPAKKSQPAPSQPKGPTRFTSKADLVNTFRDPRLFVAYEENKDKVDEYMKSNNITTGEIDNLMLADENEDFFKMQKQVWDAKRKKFKKVLINAKGDQIDEDGTKLKVIKDKMKKLGSKYKKWKRATQVRVGQAGTEEDTEQVSKARGMFRDRKQNNFRPIRRDREESGGRPPSQKELAEGRLKTAKELLSIKRKKEIVKMKNMPRDAKKRMRERRQGGESFKGKGGRNSGKPTGKGRSQSKGRGQGKGFGKSR